MLPLAWSNRTNPISYFWIRTYARYTYLGILSLITYCPQCTQWDKNGRKYKEFFFSGAENQNYFFNKKIFLNFPVTEREERTNTLTPAVPRPNTTLPLNWVLPPRTKSSADNDMPHALTPPKKWWRPSDKLTFKFLLKFTLKTTLKTPTLPLP